MRTIGPALPAGFRRNPSNPSYFGVVSQGMGYVVTKRKSAHPVKVLLGAYWTLGPVPMNLFRTAL
jgi:hypothetical protein